MSALNLWLGRPRVRAQQRVARSTQHGILPPSRAAATTAIAGVATGIWARARIAASVIIGEHGAAAARKALDGGT
jgi:hypothetical protein